MKKQYAVIGLGRFGSSVTRTLVEQGAEVLAIDNNEDKVSEALDYATHAVQADATDEHALMALGIRNFDVVCVCMGEIQSSIMIALLCIEQGVAEVLVKARSEKHAKVLQKIGVNKIVFPERDTGIRVAHNLISSNIIDFIELSEDYGIAELEVEESWIGKSIIELDFRREYGLNIVAIKHDENNINVNPIATDRLDYNDALIVIGSEEHISRVQSLVKSSKGKAQPKPTMFKAQLKKEK